MRALGASPAIPPTTPPEFVPTAALDIDLPSTGATTVSIPGDVAVPQGRLRVENPRGFDVSTTGGVLAARFDVVDARAAGPQTVPIGFVESVVQRKFRIVSTTGAGGETSTAVVQVNQNGADGVDSWQVQ